MWGDWMTIGEGLVEGRNWAMQMARTNRPEGKYAEWLKRYRVDDMDKSDRAKLLQLMEERPAVEECRATLTDNERRMLNHPVIVWRKWTAATRVKKPKSRTAAVSANEMGRARAMVEQLQARISELEEEVQSARAAKANLWKGKSVDEIADELIEALNPKEFERLAKLALITALNGKTNYQIANIIFDILEACGMGADLVGRLYEKAQIGAWPNHQIEYLWSHAE